MASLRGGLSLKLESDLCSLAYTLLSLPHPLLQKQHSSDLPLQVLLLPLPHWTTFPGTQFLMKEKGMWVEGVPGRSDIVSNASFHAWFYPRTLLVLLMTPHT